MAEQDGKQQELVLVGEITAPFGVRGQLKMVPYLEYPEILTRLPAVTIQQKSGTKMRWKVTSVRPHQSRSCVVTFAEVNDRDVAENLRGASLFVERQELPALPEGEYYQADLLNLQVMTDTGRDFGRITEVLLYPANAVYETPVALIPAVESIVLSIDLESGIITVRDLIGLRKDEL